MNPAISMALWRFARVLIAGAVTLVLTQAIVFVTNDPVFSDPMIRTVVVAILVAIDKAWRERDTTVDTRAWLKGKRN